MNDPMASSSQITSRRSRRRYNEWDGLSQQLLNPTLPVDQDTVTSDRSDSASEPELGLDDVFSSLDGHVSDGLVSNEGVPDEDGFEEDASENDASDEDASPEEHASDEDAPEEDAPEEDASEEDVFEESSLEEDDSDELAFGELHLSELSPSHNLAPSYGHAFSDGLGSTGSDILYHEGSSPSRSEMSVSDFNSGDDANSVEDAQFCEDGCIFDDGDNLDWDEELCVSAKSGSSADSSARTPPLDTFASGSSAGPKTPAELDVDKLCQDILEKLIEVSPFDLRGLVSSRRSRMLLLRDIREAVNEFQKTARHTLWRGFQRQMLNVMGVGVHPDLLRAAQTLIQQSQALPQLSEDEVGSAFLWPEELDELKPEDNWCENEFVEVTPDKNRKGEFNMEVVKVE